jgi:hypothetical protein
VSAAAGAGTADVIRNFGQLQLLAGVWLYINVLACHQGWWQTSKLPACSSCRNDFRRR